MFFTVVHHDTFEIVFEQIIAIMFISDKLIKLPNQLILEFMEISFGLSGITFGSIFLESFTMKWKKNTFLKNLKKEKQILKPMISQ